MDDKTNLFKRLQPNVVHAFFLSSNHGLQSNDSDDLQYILNATEHHNKDDIILYELHYATTLYPNQGEALLLCLNTAKSRLTGITKESTVHEFPNSFMKGLGGIL